MKGPFLPNDFVAPTTRGHSGISRAAADPDGCNKLASQARLEHSSINLLEAVRRRCCVGGKFLSNDTLRSTPRSDFLCSIVSVMAVFRPAPIVYQPTVELSVDNLQNGHRSYFDSLSRIMIS